MERILLVGGTGTLGRAVGLRLLSAGRTVRVLTRAPERAAALRVGGAEIVTGDLLDVQSIEQACRGVTHVITTANAFIGSGRNSVRTVDEQGNRRLIDAAGSQGVRRFVFTSALLGDAYGAIDYFAAKRHIEAYLRAGSLPFTILRPTAFMETWAMVIGEPMLRTGATNIFGPGTHPINFVAVDNVADVAVLALDDPAALNGMVEIGGPENLTLNQVVDIFERVRGRPGRRRHLPVALLHGLGVLLQPFKPALARQMKAGALMGSGPQLFDPGPMLERYPVVLIPLEEWVRQRYGP